MSKHIQLGDKFGKLLVIGSKPGVGKQRRQYHCKCDCGNETWKDDKYLKNRVDVTCGCHLVKNKDTKVCPMCNQEKSKSEYHKLSSKSGGINSKCIECTSKYKKKRYWDNRDIELAKMTNSRLKPENVKQRQEYYNKNKESYTKRYKKYMADPKKKERRKKVSDKYRSRPEVKERDRFLKYVSRQKPEIRLKLRLRARLRNVINGLKGKTKKCKSALSLLGCDLDFFRNYIESKFTEGMTWESFINEDIHLDHIRPCASYNLTIQEEQEKCFHFSNIQPLWWYDNLSKGSKYDGN